MTKKRKAHEMLKGGELEAGAEAGAEQQQESQQQQQEQQWQQEQEYQRNQASLQVWQRELEENVDDLDTESATTAVEPPPYKKTTRRKVLKSAALMKRISLSCEWNMCTSVFNKVESFMSHTADHLAAETDPPSNDGYLCHWRECGSVCSNKEELDRHVFFHAFHTKIKSIGALLMKEIQEQCILDTSGCNMVPEIPEAFQCMWEDCSQCFSSAQDFYWHVQGHVRITDPGKDLKYKCGWEGCTSSFHHQLKLLSHTRSHTQEKLVGCPNCGCIYASNTKFFDHCVRQIPLDSQQFQCSHCSRRYANERLLRDHVRHHINHYKCSQCDMTVPNKSTLAAHIRYRHSSHRPHKCPQCGRGFTAITDLSRHLSIHSEEPPYICPYQQCVYKCRSLTTFNRHIKQNHNGIGKYVCHMCDAKFGLGESLTKHLVKEHSFLSPVGHTRFRYKQDEDGFYRLQTVRYESIENTHGVGEEEEGEEGGVVQSQVGEGAHLETFQDTPSSTSPSSPSCVAYSVPPMDSTLQVRNVFRNWKQGC